MKKVVVSCRMALEDGRNSRNINEEIDMASDVLATFRGPGKEAAFSAWVSANKPGYVYAPNSGGIKELGDVGISKKEPKASKPKSKKQKTSTSSGSTIINAGKAIWDDIGSEERRKKEEKAKFDPMISEVVSLTIPEDSEGLISLIDELFLKMKVNNWKANAEAQNKLSDAYFNKIKLCLNKLNRIDSNFETTSYEKRLKRINILRLFKRFLG